MAINQNRIPFGEGKYDRTPNLTLEHVKIAKKNFRGINHNGYNAQNKKTFWVILDPERFDIQAMQAQGWNVREIYRDEEHQDEPVMYRLEVEMKWDRKPPTITQVIKEDGKIRKVPLTEKAAECLDTSKVTEAILEIGHGSTYSINGKTGIKAYLRRGYFETEVDPWDKYYADEDVDSPFDDDDIIDN